MFFSLSMYFLHRPILSISNRFVRKISITIIFIANIYPSLFFMLAFYIKNYFECLLYVITLFFRYQESNAQRNCIICSDKLEFSPRGVASKLYCLVVCHPVSRSKLKKKSDYFKKELFHLTICYHS